MSLFQESLLYQYVFKMSINRNQTATAVIPREELCSTRREEIFTFCSICFYVVSGSLLPRSRKKSMLTKKIALGLNCKVIRLLLILPAKAGVVCKRETFRDWL